MSDLRARLENLLPDPDYPDLPHVCIDSDGDPDFPDCAACWIRDIRAALKVEHRWVDVATFGQLNRHYLCADCGMTRTEEPDY
jgi:hypothetical protein